MSQVVIRPATVADAHAITQVRVRSWQWAYHGLLPDEYLEGLTATAPERARELSRRLAEPERELRWWVAERAGDVVGFASTGPTRDRDVPSGTAEVMALYLTPEETGKGTGRQLFTRAVEDLRRRGFAGAMLWVLATNQRTRGFYEAAGWTADGTTRTERRPCVMLREARYVTRW